MIKALNDHNYTNDTKHVEKHNNIVQEGNSFTIIQYGNTIDILTPGLW